MYKTPKDFETHDGCLAFLFALRHPDAACAACGRTGAFHRHPAKPCYTCNCGRTHIYPQQQTIFRQSHVPLPVWFKALRLYHKSGGICTARSMEEALGVSYRTAWRMTNVIRKAAGADPASLSFESFLERCLAARP